MLVRGRELLLVFVGSVLISIPLTNRVLSLVGSMDLYWRELVWSYVLQGLMICGLLLLAVRREVDLRKVVGPPPGWRRLGRTTLAAIPLVFVSVAEVRP